MLNKDFRGLAGWLSERVDERVEVTYTDNVRRMLSMKRRKGTVCLRLHQMFSEADERIWRAIARYVTTRGNEGHEVIREYVRQNDHKIRQKQRRVILRPYGEHFDLEKLRDEVCERYFPGTDPPHITWGRTTRGKNRRSIQFASFDAGKHLVRVNPKLDASFVPEFFMRYLIYHEIMHRKHRPRPGDVHTEQYRAALEQHPDHERAKQWEKDNLYRFVRAAKKPDKSG